LFDFLIYPDLNKGHTHCHSKMAEQQIKLERKGNVYVLTFTGSPHKANVFNIPLLKRLDKCLDEVEINTPCALILTGAGKFFSAGFDLKALTGTRHDKSAKGSNSMADKTAEGKELVNFTWKVLARLLVFPVPTIAFFNGHAFGLGLFIGLACDFRIMDETCHGFLCLPEITIGLPLGSGFAALAKCKMTPSALRTSALTGKQWTGQEALQHGIIDSIVPQSQPSDSGKVPRQVLEMAEKLAATSKKGNLSKIKLELYRETYNILAQRSSKL
jgi:enoyl-CoA hydratase/carnithine racemase